MADTPPPVEPPQDEPTPAVRRRRIPLLDTNPLRLYDPRAHLTFAMVISLAIGITLVAQPGRYGNTPSYANLIDVLPTQAWGVVYCAVGAAQAATILRYSHRVLWLTAHTVSITLLTVWLVAFIVRYVTDSGTTIVNVTSWSTYLYLNIRSALMIDDDHRLRLRARGDQSGRDRR